MTDIDDVKAGNRKRLYVSAACALGVALFGYHIGSNVMATFWLLASAFIAFGAYNER